MRHFLFCLLLSFSGFFYCKAQKKTNNTSELWDVNSLTLIGGHAVTVDGNPVVYSDNEMGDAVKFDGNGDMLTVDAAPIDSAISFTVEVIFKPDGNALNITNQPRFLCFWDPNDVSSGPRMTIELRVTSSYEWYFDGFLKTDAANLTLTDATRLHPTGKWMHAAVVYQNKTFTTFINGVQELSGSLSFSNKVLNRNGKVSVGARFNKTNWYSGLIKYIKITRSSLTPQEFITWMLPTGYTDISDSKNQINFFPVPAQSVLNIENPESQADIPVFISLYSITGDKVQDGYYQFDANHTLKLKIQNLHSGFYFLRMQGKNANITRKITITH